MWLSVCLSGPYADLHMGQRIPLPLTVSCFSKIQIGFTFLVPAHPGSPGRRAFKLVCVCVCTLDSHRQNESVFSFLRQCGTVHIRPSHAVLPCCFSWRHCYRSISPTSWAHSSKPTTAACSMTKVKQFKLLQNTAQWQVILNILVLVGFVNYSLKTVLLDTVQGTRCTEDHLHDETLLNGLD